MMNKPTRHYRHWSEGERDRLRIELAEKPIATLAKKLGRSRRAVQNRINAGPTSLRRTRVRAYGMGTLEVAAALGCVESVVRDLIASGRLKAARVRLYTGWCYAVDPWDLTAFLEEGGALQAFGGCGAWHEEIAQARAALERRLIATNPLAALLGLDPRALRHLRTRRGFPAPALTLHSRHGGNYYERAAIRAWLRSHPEYRTLTVWEALS